MARALSEFLDAARWIAALIVLIGHAGVLINFHDIMVAPHGPGVYLWWFVAALWHPAVVVFFVTSGFLVGGAALRRLRAPAPMLRNYFIDRFSRVYIVFLPALALGVLVDAAGRALFAHSGLYDWDLLEPFFDPRNIFTALAQQQGLWGRQVGTNGPLWSLAYEFWYYVTFPLLMLPLSPYYGTATRWAGAIVGISLVLWLSLAGRLSEFNFFFGYLIWGAGVAVALARRPLLKSKWAALILFLIVTTIVRLAARGAYVETHPWIYKAADLAVAGSFANLLISLRFAGDEGFRALGSGLHRRFADFSFSVYATHAPLVFFVWAGARHYFGRNWENQLPTPTHWALVFLLLTTALAFGYGFSLFTETGTSALRDWLRSVFERLGRLHLIARARPSSGEKTA